MRSEYLNRPIPADGDPHLVMIVRQTVTITSKVPINRSHYPDEATIGDALDYERNLPTVEKIQHFVESIEASGSDDLDFAEVIDVEVPHVEPASQSEPVLPPTLHYASPKHQVTITGDRRGVQIGDGNTMFNNFG